MWTCIAPCREHTSKVLRYGTRSQGVSVLPAHAAFIHQRNEPYLPLPSQPKLVLIYQPRRDGRLSWPYSLTHKSTLAALNHVQCGNNKDIKAIIILLLLIIQFVRRHNMTTNCNEQISTRSYHHYKLITDFRNRDRHTLRPKITLWSIRVQ